MLLLDIGSSSFSIGSIVFFYFYISSVLIFIADYYYHYDKISSLLTKEIFTDNVRITRDTMKISLLMWV